MKVIETIQLNEKGVNVKEQDNPMATRYFDDNGGLPKGNYDENNIFGSWVVVEGKHEFKKYAYRTIDNCTLVPEEIFKKSLN